MGNYIDLTGQRFERLTVVRRHGTNVSPSGQKQPLWECLCDCGRTTISPGQSLRRGESKSCGCWSADRRRALAHDLSGQRFGRLVAMRRGETLPGNSTTWVCDCDCGATGVVVGTMLLKRGAAMSCGCLNSIRSSRRRWVGDDISYLGMHDRMRALRGLAREHKCVDCGAQALDWSYDGGDPNERREIVLGSNLAYSTNADYYSPRCRKCHRRHDVAARKAAS